MWLLSFPKVEEHHFGTAENNQKAVTRGFDSIPEEEFSKYYEQ